MEKHITSITIKINLFGNKKPYLFLSPLRKTIHNTFDKLDFNTLKITQNNGC